MRHIVLFFVILSSLKEIKGDVREVDGNNSNIPTDNIQRSNDKNNLRKPRWRQRRRNQMDDNSMQEFPCVKEDGSIVVPEEFIDSGGSWDDNFYNGGSRSRILKTVTLKQRRKMPGEDHDWGSAWDFCEDSTSHDEHDDENDDDDDDDNNLIGNNPLLKPVLLPTQSPSVRSPSGTPSGKTDSPSFMPTGVPNTLSMQRPSLEESIVNTDKIPIIQNLPNLFFVEDEINVIRCWVSAALPKARENIDSEGRAARLFQAKVAKVMAEVIEAATKFKVWEAEQEISLQLNDMLVSKEASESTLDTYKSGYMKGKGDDQFTLIHSRSLSNITKVGESEDATWWMYEIAFFTIADDYTSVNNTINQMIKESIVSKNYFDNFQTRLKGKYKRLVGVSIPGNERLNDINEEQTTSSSTTGAVFETANNTGYINQMWGPSEWIGLGLFSVTVLFVCSLTLTGHRRRRKLEKQENWGVGKLATEKDINELLSYGWEYNGNEVRTFDKSKIIYRDDDSMLIGGALPSHNAGTTCCVPTEALTTMTGASPSEQNPSFGSSGMGTNSAGSKELP